MVEVEFITEFADKKAGDRFKCDPSLANQLIVGDKVAKLVTADKEEKKEPVKKAVKGK